MKTAARTALAAIFFGAVRAAGADFTFEVPVEVRNLPPEVVVVFADCGVYHDAGERLGGIFSNGARLAGGSFVGTITIAFDVPPLPDGRRGDPRRANNYICTLRLVRSDSTVWEGPAAPGAVQRVQGPIPSGH